MKAVNLLPPDLAGSPRGAAAGGPAAASGPAAYIVLGALALALVALAGYVLTANTVKQREADLATVTAESLAVTRQAAALKPYADFDAVAKARIKTVHDLVNQRFAWNRALRDLSRAIPADVTLSQLDGTVSSGTAGGGAGALRGALDVPAFELQGCTRSQTDVARLMSRLRNVTGVTRVALGKSDKETPTARPVGPAGSTSTADGAAGACGRPDAPTFDVIAFFEHDAGAAVAADPAVQTNQAGANLAASAAEASSEPPTGSASTTTSTDGVK